ncbi:helix-turn-helix transcriptional regulator [Lachnoclostridium sp. Marseille-P6806]|uniref:helix-turn-helix transcriptional regulator n=1 Tax=Lachnoclostridium sp. Marseille-P6806 TaxID=2364793 RepID=UPI0010318184|nr:helix-turn-helix transcriptional regulator [Lachnoclostridium sp. Marseille-P6806]
MTFGEKIKEARTHHNLSQVELAEKVGKSRRTVIDWENGKALPRTRKVYEALAKVLDVSVPYLLTDEEAFILSAEEQFGYRGKKDARQLVSELTGLFAGGKMAEEDMDALMFAIQQAYVDAKRNNKKYTPKKYQKHTDSPD